MMAMVFIKHLASLLAKGLLQAELLAWIILTTLVMLVGSATPVKQSLERAGLYDSVVDTVLNQSDLLGGSNPVPLDDQAIRALAKQALSEQQLKTYGEEFVDGTYRWLEGKSPEPDFKIDLTAARQTVASGVANKSAERLAGLPPCTRIPTGSLDPFSITCLPPGINIERERQKILDELLANKDFIPQTVITAEQLPKSSDGRSFAEANEKLPGRFQLIKRLPLILALSAALSAAAIIWLANNKRRGIRSVGRVALGIGGFVLLVTIIFGFALPKISADLSPRFIGGDAAPLFNRTLEVLTQTANKALLITSGAIAVLGGAILLAERYMKTTHPEELAEGISLQTTQEKQIATKQEEDIKNDRSSNQNKV